MNVSEIIVYLILRPIVGVIFIRIYKYKETGHYKYFEGNVLFGIYCTLKPHTHDIKMCGMAS